jgi:hypothetical protein
MCGKNTRQEVKMVRFFKKVFLLLLLAVLVSAGSVFSGEVIQTQESVAWEGIEAGKFRGLWIKFPEPTDRPETIMISLEGISPFEEITLKK